MGKVPLLKRKLTKQEKLSRLDSAWSNIETGLIPKVKPEDQDKVKTVLREKYEKLRKQVEKEDD